MKRGVKHKSSAMGAIRIISGQHGGRKLPVADLPGLRPTTDRTKETLFNWLTPYLRNARCLDMFAGSGSLGFEALSRYASFCSFIEQDKSATNIIKGNIQLLKLNADTTQVLTGDALQQLSQLQGQYDLVFIDPPFHQGLVPKVLDKLSTLDLLAKDGLIYIETELENSQYQVPGSWSQLKQKQTKQLCYRLYQYTGV